MLCISAFCFLRVENYVKLSKSKIRVSPIIGTVSVFQEEPLIALVMSSVTLN